MTEVSVTIAVDGVSQTIDGPHAQLIGEAVINGHDSFGDEVAYCSSTNSWSINTNDGRLITVRFMAHYRSDK